MPNLEDVRYFRYLARTLSIKENISFDKAVYKIQLQYGEEWNTKTISSVYGISIVEIEKILKSAMDKITPKENEDDDYPGQTFMFADVIIDDY